MRPSIGAVLMDMATLMATRSTCPYLHVGCVISRDGRILTSGYNGAPSGMEHCTHGKRAITDQNSPTCTTAIHAEANAIAFAARHGVQLNGAVMHTTLSPCRTCAQLIIQVGIVMVYCGELYRLPDGINLLRDAGVGVFPDG